MKAVGREKEEEFSRSRPYECVIKEGGGNQVKNFEEESQTSSCETIEKHPAFYELEHGFISRNIPPFHRSHHIIVSCESTPRFFH